MDISDTKRLGSGGDEAAMTALIGLLVCILSFLIIGPLIGILFAIPFIDGDLLTLADKLTNPSGYPEFRLPLYIIQGVAATVGLIITPWLFLIIRKEQPWKQFLAENKTTIGYVLSAVVVISFMGFNSLIIDWNANIQLPESLKGLEEWARDKENMAAELTEFLTTFDSTGLFILAFVVIAIIPGIGEELVFRGVFQKKIMDAGLNGHLAVWAGAILFSSIHLQFFGFFPRMFLGALFGYLYWWSGDLKVAMLAHFVNNAFTLIMVYQYQQGLTDTNIEQPDSLPLATVVIMSIITVAILFYLYKRWTQQEKLNGNLAEGI